VPRYRPEPIDRPTHASAAIRLFNGGSYWDAHEALELMWRSTPDDDEAAVLQGLIQAAAALLHRERDNGHGVRVVGAAALTKLRGPQHPAVEFETVDFGSELAHALQHDGPPPVLRLRMP
jgi:hypothetical protein